MHVKIEIIFLQRQGMPALFSGNKVAESGRKRSASAKGSGKRNLRTI
jgi:hypothetical protein